MNSDLQVRSANQGEHYNTSIDPCGTLPFYNDGRGNELSIETKYYGAAWRKAPAELAMDPTGSSPDTFRKAICSVGRSEIAPSRSEGGADERKGHSSTKGYTRCWYWCSHGWYTVNLFVYSVFRLVNLTVIVNV